MTTPAAPAVWITRSRALLWLLGLVGGGVLAVLTTPPSPWVHLPGTEMSSGDRTSTLHGVRFHRVTRELRGRVTFSGVDVASEVTIDEFNAVLINETTWQTISVPARVSMRRLSPRGPLVLEGSLDRVPDGFYPYGVDVNVSFEDSNGEADGAGMGTGAWFYQAIDDEDLDRIVAGGAQAVPGLLEQTYSTDAIERDIAVMALGRIGAKADSVVSRLRELLDDTHTAVKTSAAGALGRYGPRARPAVEDLSAVLRDPEAYDIVKRSVLFALTELGPAAAPAVPDLIDVIRGDNFLYRLLAIQAIASVGPEAGAARPLLLELQASETLRDGNTRKALSSALDHIGGA